MQRFIHCPVFLRSEGPDRMPRRRRLWRHKSGTKQTVFQPLKEPLACCGGRSFKAVAFVCSEVTAFHEDEGALRRASSRLGRYLRELCRRNHCRGLWRSLSNMILQRTYRQIAKQPSRAMARSGSEIHSRGQSGGVINILRADISRAEYPHAFDSGVVPSKASRTHDQSQCRTRDKAQGYFHLQISLEFCLKACLWGECLGSFSLRNLLSLRSTGLERRGGSFTA
jgi:hypothetical protein